MVEGMHTYARGEAVCNRREEYVHETDYRISRRKHCPSWLRIRRDSYNGGMRI
jgi:hypothetical protein